MEALFLESDKSEFECCLPHLRAVGPCSSCLMSPNLFPNYHDKGKLANWVVEKIKKSYLHKTRSRIADNRSVIITSVLIVKK